jgi:hypothetical protein
MHGRKKYHFSVRLNTGSGTRSNLRLQPPPAELPLPELPLPELPLPE